MKNLTISREDKIKARLLYENQQARELTSEMGVNDMPRENHNYQLTRLSYLW